MAIIREESQVLLVKPETTYNTDSTPTGANAIQTFNLDVSAELTKKESEVMKGFVGANDSVTVSKHVKVKFDFYLTGGGMGVDGLGAPMPNVPPCATVLLAAAHAEIQIPIGYVYQPVEDDLGSMTIYWRSGKLIRKVTGVRGSISTDFQNGDFRKATFDGFGFYDSLSKETTDVSGIDFSGLELPVAFANDTVTDCQFLGLHLQAKSVSVNFGQEFSFTDLVNFQEVEMTGRKATVSANFRTSDDDYMDIMAKAENNTKGTLILEVGKTGGNIVKISASNASITSSPALSYESGVGYLSVEANLTPNVKNADYRLGFM